MHRSLRSRSAILALGVGMLAASLAAPALAGDTRVVTVGGLPTLALSVGESIDFPVTVANGGKQTLNNVILTIGKDSVPADETDGSVVPTQPVSLPPNVTIAAAGCTATDRVLTCVIGTLRPRSAATFEVTIDPTADAAAGAVPLKAVVTVAEIGNDQGANNDTFAAEGVLTLRAADCNSIAAQRTSTESRIVSTCGVTVDGMSASIQLPSGRSYVDLSDNNDCPGCIGKAVIADIHGDTTTDVVPWVIQVDVTGFGNINLTKLVVVHTNDAGTDSPPIPLTRKNACNNTGNTQDTNCGSAQIFTVDGRTILEVTVQTPGNGKTRIF